jgi:hypothetical protein
MKIFLRGANNIGTITRPMQLQVVAKPAAALVQSRASKLIAEWQHRGPETVSGHAVQKLRLSFAPTHSAETAGAVA